jgi:hypothetical protein
MHQGRPVPFDLLVIDEGPWFGLLAGLDDREPLGASIDWLSPEWWEEQGSQVPEDTKATAIATLTTIHRVLVERQLGPLPPDTLVCADINETALLQARRFVLACKLDLRPAVMPGAAYPEVARAISTLSPINRRVLAVAKVLQVIRMQLQGRLAPSGVELIERSDVGGRFLRLRWREDIHPQWLRAPVLYLDAAGTGVSQIAKAWLPNIDVAVVPIPVPIDRTIAWDSLCDAAGPIEVLATRGVIPLDYAGVAKALSGWFSGPKAATDWFSERPEALARLRRIRDLAKCDGRVSIGEFSRIFLFRALYGEIRGTQRISLS